MWEVFQEYFYDIVIGIVILLAGLGVGTLVKKIVRAALYQIGFNSIAKRVGIKSDIERWAGSIIALVIYIISIVFFLDRLGIRSVVVYLMIGGVLTIFALTVIVGIKDVIPNAVAGIYFKKKKLKVGKKIKVSNIVGVIESVGYLKTKIKTRKGDLLHVPNHLFLKKQSARVKN